MQRKLAEFLNVIFGFRKFILMMFVISISVGFRIANFINGSEMVDLLKATVIAFFGANGVEHVMTVVKGSMDAKAAAANSNVAVADDGNDEEDAEVK